MPEMVKYKCFGMRFKKAKRFFPSPVKRLSILDWFFLSTLTAAGMSYAESRDVENNNHERRTNEEQKKSVLKPLPMLQHVVLCICTSHTTSSGSCMHMHSLNIICTIFCKCWQAPGVFSFGYAFFVFLLHWTGSISLCLVLAVGRQLLLSIWLSLSLSILISQFALSSFSSILWTFLW